MKVIVDPELCEANGRCFLAAPEVFAPDADGWAQVLIEHPPEELRKKVERAVRVCPRLAIRIEE